MTVAVFAPDTYLNAQAGGVFYFQVANVNCAKLTATALDLSYLGNSGSIILKDDLGATKTATISGGVWVIT